MNKLRNSICDVNEEAGEDYCYWKVAHVVRDNLAVVPLRPSNEDQNEHERGRKYYKPWFVSGRNSASNVGIAHILSHILRIKCFSISRNMALWKWMSICFSNICRFVNDSQLLILRLSGLQTHFSIRIVSIWCLCWNTSILSSMVWKHCGNVKDCSSPSLLPLFICLRPRVVFAGLRNFNKSFLTRLSVVDGSNFHPHATWLERNTTSLPSTIWRRFRNEHLLQPFAKPHLTHGFLHPPCKSPPSERF